MPRIYGTDYVVVVSPQNGTIPMKDVAHTYLHYVIEPLLYVRANAIDRTQPILKEIRDAPLEFRFRSDTVPLTSSALSRPSRRAPWTRAFPCTPFRPALTGRICLAMSNERQIYQQKVEMPSNGPLSATT